MPVKTGSQWSRLVPAMLLMVVMGALLTSCLGGVDATATPTVRFGQLVTARSLANDTSPQGVTDTFSPTDTVYAVVSVQFFPNGHRVFARFSEPNGNIADTDEITANKDYSDTYLEFHIAGSDRPLVTGQYKVQLIVDGNPDQNAVANFTVR